MEENIGFKKCKVLDLVQVALMAAIVCVVTSTIKLPTQIGYTHLGDSMVFLAAILLGKKKGFISAALGMFLADVLGGYFVWAGFSFVIKGLMAYITGYFAYKDAKEGKDIKKNIIGCIVASIWMVIAYYFANIIITRYILVKTASLSQSRIIALSEIPGNIIEVLIGMALALPLGKILKDKVKI